MRDEIILHGDVKSSNLYNGGMQNRYDDSISLLDIFRVFHRNKKPFLLTFFMALILGSAIVFLSPARYDVALNINTPYSYSAAGAIYYPLGFASDHNSNNFVVNSEFGRFFSMFDDYLSGTNYATQNHVANPVLSFLNSSGNIYSSNPNALPINNSEYMLHIDGVSLKGVAAATRKVDSEADALVKLGNSQLVDKKKVIMNNILLLEQQLTMVNSLIDASNHSHGNMFSADPSKSIFVLLNESNALNDQRAILANWHDFSRGTINVNKNLANNYIKLALTVFVAFILGVLVVAGFEISNKLKFENGNGA